MKEFEAARESLTNLEERLSDIKAEGLHERIVAMEQCLTSEVRKAFEVVVGSSMTSLPSYPIGEGHTVVY